MLKGIDLEVAQGELISIMGASDSGKSTMFNILGILDDYDNGNYYLAGRLIKNLNETQAAARNRNAHIERKKSKCDYLLAQAPTEEQIRQIETAVNEIIASALPVTTEFMSKEEAGKFVDLSKLPPDASPTLRIVKIGDYDTCACLGAHVENTSQIAPFKIISHEYSEGRWRVRFKLME